MGKLYGTLTVPFTPFPKVTKLLVHNTRRLFDALDLADEAEALAMGVGPDEYGRLTTLSDWASSFLCRSHEDLGRAGPVCPYARVAIEQGIFLLGEIDLPFDRTDAIADEIRIYKEWFVSLQGVLGPERNACVLLSLPQCDPVSTEQIDLLQRHLKDEFIAEELMVGQFHPHHAEPGLWSPDFRPLAAPVPAIAIRRLVSSDLPFLVGRAAWVQKYLETFAPAMPRHTVTFLSALVADVTTGT